ncbi:MAG: hypothetical protein WCH76_08305 [Candidatus Riflemargulisbacteria bacterium]
MGSLIKASNTGMVVLSPELERDFKTTSNNLEELIEMGQEGLKASLEILIATEATPLTVKAFSELLKTVATLNLQHLEIQKTKANLANGGSTAKVDVTADAKTVNQTQIIFSGSINDLSRVISESNFKE